MSSALSLLFSKIKEKIIYLFIYGCTGSSGCVQVFSSCERGLLFTAVCRFSLLWLLLLQSTDSRTHRLQQLWYLSSRAQAQ